MKILCVLLFFVYLQEAHTNCTECIENKNGLTEGTFEDLLSLDLQCYEKIYSEVHHKLKNLSVLPSIPFKINIKNSRAESNNENISIIELPSFEPKTTNKRGKMSSSRNVQYNNKNQKSVLNSATEFSLAVRSSSNQYLRNLEPSSTSGSSSSDEESDSEEDSKSESGHKSTSESDSDFEGSSSEQTDTYETDSSTDNDSKSSDSENDTNNCNSCSRTGCHNKCGNQQPKPETESADNYTEYTISCTESQSSNSQSGDSPSEDSQSDDSQSDDSQSDVSQSDNSQSDDSESDITQSDSSEDFYFEENPLHTYAVPDSSYGGKIENVRIIRAVVNKTLKFTPSQNDPKLELPFLHVVRSGDKEEETAGILTQNEGYNYVKIIDEKIQSIANLEGTDNFQNGPRSAEVSLDNVNIWHPFDIGVNNPYSENVHIKEVVWNQKLKLDEPVVQWVSSRNKAAGRAGNRLTLLSGAENNFQVAYSELADAISSMAMFEWWNEEERTLETILITATDARVDWYRFTDDSKLEQLWTWELQEPVTDVHVFRRSGKYQALVCFDPYQDDSQADGTYCGVYGLEPWRSWWLEQRLEGAGGAAGPAPAQLANWLFVPHAHAQVVNCYMYDHKKRLYTLKEAVAAPGVTGLAAFSGGAQAFLAVAAPRAAIYRLGPGAAVRETTVDHHHLGPVDCFLPLQTDYLRNEVVLLMQQELDHHTHFSKSIEALRWNGRSFEMVEHAPCKSHGADLFGFACMVDSEANVGIRGAAVLRKDESPSVLLASDNHAPLLFDVSTATLEQPDPLNAKVKHTLETIKMLEEKFQAQTILLDQMQNELQSKPKRQRVGKNWKINKITAPVINIQGDLPNADEQMILKVGGRRWINPSSFASPEYGSFMKSNNDRIKKIINSLSNVLRTTESLKELKIPIIFNRGLTVDGVVKADDAVINTINNVMVDQVLSSSKHKGKDHKLHIHNKYLDTVTVNNLFVHNTINGLSIFEKTSANKSLIISGDVYLNNTLKVSGHIGLSGLVNNIDVSNLLRVDSDVTFNHVCFKSLNIHNQLTVSNSINNMIPSREGIINARSGQELSQLDTDNLDVEKMVVSGNIYVKQINGLNWDLFEQDLVFTDQPVYLDTLHIEGKLTALDSFTIGYLNSLAFPKEFVNKNEKGPITISGNKIFTNIISAKSAFCLDSINKVNPQDIVTTSMDKNLGNVTFFSLSVMNDFAVQGKITGGGIEELLQNPSIIDSIKIQSNLVFRDLRVIGPIFIKRFLNNTEISILKSQIYLKNSDVMIIESYKEFSNTFTVNKGLKIKSNKLSSLQLNTLLTKNITSNNKESISFGHAIIKTLIVKGSFAGTNVTDSLKNAVFINGDQMVHGKIVLQDTAYLTSEPYNSVESQNHAITLINNFVITDLCNGWKIKDNIMTIDKITQSLKSPSVYFQYLKANTLLIHGSIHTDYKVAGVDLKYFDSTRLSVTKDQEITGKFSIRNCTSYGNIMFDYVNNYPAATIMNATNTVLNVENQVFTGIIALNYLHVKNLVTNGINNKYLTEISKTAINLNTKNEIISNITFLEIVNASHLTIAGYFNEEYFPKFLKNTVHFNDNSIVIQGELEYVYPITVKETLKCKYLNDIDTAHILHKGGSAVISQATQIIGNIEIKNNLNISGYYNDEHFSDVDVTVVSENEAIINCDVVFNGEHQVNNLIIKGLVNNKYNFDNVMKSVTWLNKKEITSLNVTFRAPVLIQSDIIINNLYNNIKLQKLLDEIIYIDQGMELKGRVIFTDMLKISNELTVTEKFLSEVINGYDLNVWKSNAILEDNADTFLGTQTFKSITVKNEIDADYINDLKLDQILTLNTEQFIPTLTIDALTITKKLTVDGTVNSINIEEVYNNTLMTFGTQIVNTPLQFMSKVFANNLTRVTNVNGKFVKNIITLKTPQNLFGQYTFIGNIFSDGMEVTGSVNNINFNMWTSNTLFANNFGQNYIFGKINVNGNLLLDKLDSQTTLIGGQNVTVVKDLIDQTKESLNEFADYVNVKYKAVCNELMFLTKEINRQYKLFKYFDISQEIASLDNQYFSYLDLIVGKYMFLRDDGSCKTKIWRWNQESLKFEHWFTADTGKVVNWHPIRVRGIQFLISEVPSNDCRQRSSIWKLNSAGLLLSKPISELHLNTKDPTQAIKDVLKNYINQQDNIQAQENITPTLEDINPKYLNTTCQDKITLTLGQYAEKAIACTFLDRIEINLRNGELYTIEAQNPKLIQAIKLNNYQDAIVFVDQAETVHLYQFQEATGFKYWDNLRIPAKKLFATYLQGHSGRSSPYLLIQSPHRITLLQAVNRYVDPTHVQCF